MYIKKFKIKNFRTFGEEGITLQFNKGVNAIIGENNSGKSAIIDAIRIAYSTLTYRRDIFFSKSDFHVDEDGSVADSSQFDIYLEEVPPRLLEIWDPDSKSGHGGEFHIRFEKTITERGVEKPKPVHWGIGTEENHLSSDTFSAIEVMFLGALRDSENELRPAKNSRLALLLRSMVPDDEAQHDLVEVLQSANDALLSKDAIKNTKKTINENLAKIEQDYLSQSIDIGLVEPRFDSIASSLRAWVKPKWALVPSDDSMFVTAEQYFDNHKDNKKIHRNEKGVYFELSILEDVVDMDADLRVRIIDIASTSFELHQNGLGYNNLLFMSAVLGDMAIDRSGVYQNLLLIEEPEAHLHPQLQRLVHAFLTNANSEDGNIQIIFTSHSSTLAAKVDLANINLIYESEHVKRCLPISEANLSDPDKLYLQKYLDVSKSQMFFARGILFVEGISEALLLPEIADCLDRSFEKYAVELVNVDSVAFKPFVNMFSSKTVLTCFPKVAIVTDDDRCTKKDDTNYISKDLDFDDIDSTVLEKLANGVQSERCDKLDKLCSDAGISVFKADKTLEYALCCHENNVDYLLSAIKMEYPEEGVLLEAKIGELNDLKEKAACIWLFVQSRNKCKGSIAQYLSQIIREQNEKKKGENQ
ncbi:MAG: AAA family ATPase [Clostridiales bacterium]|nr:AAA family ATPase [Clostridiales bacterium]